MERICPECNRPVRGRMDKKFCSSQCRVAFNNRQNKDATEIIKQVNGILKRNRKILQKLNPHGKAKVHHDQLVTAGFKFSYFTNSYTTKKGNIYRFVYEYGYLKLADNMYALVKKQDYVD